MSLAARITPREDTARFARSSVPLYVLAVFLGFLFAVAVVFGRP
jgi:hypothetical protein